LPNGSLLDLQIDPRTGAQITNVGSGGERIAGVTPQLMNVAWNGSEIVPMFGHTLAAGATPYELAQVAQAQPERNVAPWANAQAAAIASATPAAERLQQQPAYSPYWRFPQAMQDQDNSLLGLLGLRR
jgi:hypothetical protein